MKIKRLVLVMMLGLGLTLAVLWSLGMPALPARAANTWTVCATGCDFTDIQLAVNNASAGDTIDIKAGTYIKGTYITVNKDLTLQGAGPDQTYVDGGDSDRVFRIEGTGTSVTLKDMTIQNGNTTPDRDGGGIKYETEDGVHLIQNCVITGNRAGTLGGGIYVAGDGSGSGAWNNHLTVASSTVSSNWGEEGGGLLISGQQVVTISESSITYNEATSEGGGGISLGSSEATLAIIGSELSHNTAYKDGGGLDITNADAWVTILDSGIFSNTAEGNESASGGGVFFGARSNNRNSFLSIANSTIAHNKAGGYAGGVGSRIESGSGNLYLNNATIAYNRGNSDGGPVGTTGGLEIGQGVTGRVANTLIAHNSDTFNANPNCAQNNGGQLVSEGYNLVGDGTNCSWPAATGDQVGSTASPIDPLLGAMMGDPAYYPLQAGSPAVDAANPATPADGQFPACWTTDQRGQARPTDGDNDGTARCDIGAYEYAPPSVAIAVTKMASPGRVEVGETITYTYKVTNTGDFSVTLTAYDDKLGAINLASTTLEAGEWTMAVTTTLVQTAHLPGPLTNTVTVTGVSGMGTVVEYAEASVELTEVYTDFTQAITTTDKVLYIPAGHVPDEVDKLTYTPLAQPGHTPPAGSGVLLVFDLTVMSGTTTLTQVSGMTVTLYYDVPANVDESKLLLYYYDSDQQMWVQIPAANILVGPANGMVIVRLEHFSEFMLVYPYDLQYMPVILK